MQGFDTWIVEVRGAGLSMRGSELAAAVMAVVGIEIVREGEGGGCCRATVPAVLQYRGYCSRDGG